MSDRPESVKFNPVNASRLFFHGQVAVRCFRARTPLNPASKPEEVEHLENLKIITLRDAVRCLPRMPLEVKLIVDGLDGKMCDLLQLSTLSVLFFCQIFGDETPTIPNLFRIVSDAKTPPEHFLRFRSKVLDNIFAGLYAANADPWIGANAVIRLAARTLFGLTGGIISGMGRWRYRRGIHYRGWDDGSDIGGEEANKQP